MEMLRCFPASDMNSYDCDDECRSVFSRLFHRDCNCELEISNVRHELNLREFLEAESNIGGLIVLVII